MNKSRKKIVVLTGAGISEESGIATFRGDDGLWEGHDVMEVASLRGWEANPELVLDFYNKRRRSAHTAKPNAGHLALVDLEQKFDVTVITQNVDELHEQAGSSKVIHLHGKLFESRSSADERLIYKMSGTELNLGDMCEKGSQLRPNIVWFGEPVPMMEPAMEAAAAADYFLIVGTSLVVYPAAGLIHYAKKDVPVYIIDPNIPKSVVRKGPTIFYQEKAGSGTPKVVKKLLEEVD